MEEPRTPSWGTQAIDFYYLLNSLKFSPPVGNGAFGVFRLTRCDEERAKQVVELPSLWPQEEEDKEKREEREERCKEEEQPSQSRLQLSAGSPPVLACPGANSKASWLVTTHIAI